MAACFFSVHGKALESLQMDQYQNRKMPGPKMDIEAPDFVKSLIYNNFTGIPDGIRRLIIRSDRECFSV